MNRKEQTKTFMMILNWKKTFGCDVVYKLIQSVYVAGQITIIVVFWPVLLEI